MKTAAERMRDRRERLRAVGKCQVCGNAPAEPGKTSCAPCQAGAAERTVESRERKRIMREIWNELCRCRDEGGVLAFQERRGIPLSEKQRERLQFVQGKIDWLEIEYADLSNEANMEVRRAAKMAEASVG